MKTADIIVIGAGMAGLSAGASLAPERKVVVLEAEKQIGYHSSARSAAMMIRNYGSDVLRQLNEYSYQLYKSLEQTLEQPLLSPRGELLVANAQELEKLDAYLALSPDLKALNIEQAVELCPALRKDTVVKAAIEPEAADIDVDLLLQHYARTLKAHSGEICLESRVNTLLYNDNQWQLETTSGTYVAPVVINASGAWADVVAKKAGLSTLGMMPLRRSAAVIKVAEFDNIDRWPVVVSISENWYAKPQSGMLIVSPADEELVEPHDAWPEDMTLAEGLHRFEQFMAIEVKRIESSWAGLRTFVKDRNPVVGFSDQAPGFFWLAGQGGYGIQTAPVLAQISSDIICSREQQWPQTLLAALSPQRKL